eukprot:CAMPEP_0196594706 /NCGR_PEP_ID=MMETSP1081-20130531/79059_1 /TAXON_ID=36882 /ORGANISM="Pyramimonas amylifera, Strain CCMP720" /LENGTH=128 /DNA_ID=CAMNT_0041919033 /DNA_START=1 /DNA_END=387 /DNA_ORIENTATION=-
MPGGGEHDQNTESQSLASPTPVMDPEFTPGQKNSYNFRKDFSEYHGLLKENQKDSFAKGKHTYDYEPDRTQSTSNFRRLPEIRLSDEKSPQTKSSTSSEEKQQEMKVAAEARQRHIQRVRNNVFGQES